MATPRCNRRATRRMRRRRSPPFVLLLIAVAIVFSSAPSSFRYSSCLADESVDEDDDDFLAEILAEQAREEEELSRMEAEAKEFDAMKARQPSGGGMPGGGKGGGAGGPKMGKMGGGAGRMPQGAGGTNFSKLEEDLKKKEDANADKLATQDEEKVSQEAERIRQKREAEFEAELKRMNEEQRKKAQIQKKKDAKVVTRILKSHNAGKHYAVLGIRNFEVQVGPFYIFNFSLGPLILFRVKTKEIKRVYRNLARTVHPDKNKDGRAEEAFHALESSAAILTDEKQRSDYDKRIISARRRRNKYAMESVVGVSQQAWGKSVSSLRVAKKVLGPFSTPILVVGALII